MKNNLLRKIHWTVLLVGKIMLLMASFPNSTPRQSRLDSNDTSSSQTTTTSTQAFRRSHSMLKGAMRKFKDSRIYLCSNIRKFAHQNQLLGLAWTIPHNIYRNLLRIREVHLHRYIERLFEILLRTDHLGIIPAPRLIIIFLRYQYITSTTLAMADIIMIEDLFDTEVGNMHHSKNPSYFETSETKKKTGLSMEWNKYLLCRPHHTQSNP